MTGMTHRLRQLRSDGERGTLPMFMLITIIALGIGALLVPIVVRQSHSTIHTDERVQYLHAAQSGIDVALGELRSANTPTGGAVKGTFTDASSLPCTTTSPTFTGTDAGSIPLKYSVSITYYDVANHIMTCPLAAPPSRAEIRSTGSAVTSSSNPTRILTASYAFSSATYNTQTITGGGQIRLNPLAVGTPATVQCVDAGSTRSVGSTLTAATCLTATDVQSTATPQLFYYGTDLTLHLYYSRTATNPAGLCIADAAGTVTLQACAASGVTPSLNQQWRLNDTAQFKNSGTSQCLATGPSPLVTQACGTAYTASASWAPTPSAGPGSAGAASFQLTNLGQSTRCAQASLPRDPTTNTAFVIVYPCTQTTLTVPVNQVFTYSAATQQWVTTDRNGTNYCLTSTGTLNGVVTLTTCVAGGSPNQRWTDNGAAQADQASARSIAPLMQYTISDVSGGNCLTASIATQYTSSATGQSQAYSELTTEACPISAQNPAQMWNAAPAQTGATVINTNE